MKSIAPYALIIVLVWLFLAMSSNDYETELAESQTEERLFAEQQAQAEADSLGLQGQEWIDYVNNYQINQ